ncbi:MAG: YggU family protein [Euryarchaeota archaeon]|nr:YggU family protein [Euryarchaeota archaeon]
MPDRSLGVDLSKCLRPSADGSEMDIIVTPNSTSPGVQGVDPWRHRLVVKVRAPPEGGRANEEVEDTLSSLMGVAVTVVRGHTQRMKVVRIQAPEELVSKALGGDP